MHEGMLKMINQIQCKPQKQQHDSPGQTYISNSNQYKAHLQFAWRASLQRKDIQRSIVAFQHSQVTLGDRFTRFLIDSFPIAE